MEPEASPDRHEGPAGPVISTGVGMAGPRFLTPPPHRLFAAFADPSLAAAAARELAALGLQRQDLWVYEGEEGARRIDARTRLPHHLLLRLAQVLWTTDHEYGGILRHAVLMGGAVLAIRVGSCDDDVMLAILRRYGVQTLSLTGHWNYLPVEPEGDLAA